MPRERRNVDNDADFNAWKKELGAQAVVRAVVGAAWDAFAPVIILAGLVGVVLLMARSSATRQVATEVAAAPVRLPFGFQAS
jgi:hypothetical protein